MSRAQKCSVLALNAVAPNAECEWMRGEYGTLPGKKLVVIPSTEFDPSQLLTSPGPILLGLGMKRLRLRRS